VEASRQNATVRARQDGIANPRVDRLRYLDAPGTKKLRERALDADEIQAKSSLISLRF
jgi:hypothetical protein